MQNQDRIISCSFTPVCITSNINTQVVKKQPQDGTEAHVLYVEGLFLALISRSIRVEPKLLLANT